MHAPPPVPSAVAFRNAEDGLLGTDRTIETTADGGKTWRVVFRTPRPVTSVSYDPSGQPRAILDDGENLGGRSWRPTYPLGHLFAPCQTYDNGAVFSGAWVLCIGQASAGSGFKTAYRLVGNRWRRCGSLTRSGYGIGIAMARDGFGIVWESRGTLWVTRDFCAHWAPRSDVAIPEIDFGISGAAVPHGVGWVILARGNLDRRLLETTDYGRTWRVVHRWR